MPTNDDIRSMAERLESQARAVDKLSDPDAARLDPARHIKDAAAMLRALLAEREAVVLPKSVIHDWIREDLPLAAKLNMTSKHVDKLLARLVSREWRDMDSAPRDGTEILAWRVDAGSFICRYTTMDEVVDRDQNGDPKEDYEDHEGWFHDAHGWQDDDLAPTKWLPLPTPETSK